MTAPLIPDELAEEVAGRMAPDIEPDQIMDAEEVFAIRREELEDE